MARIEYWQGDFLFVPFHLCEYVSLHTYILPIIIKDLQCYVLNVHRSIQDPM